MQRKILGEGKPGNPDKQASGWLLTAVADNR